MEIHSVRIEHAVQSNAMSYGQQRQQQNHRPSNHAQNAVSADLYKPSRSPVSAGRYPYPSAPSSVQQQQQQQAASAPNMAQRYQQQQGAYAPPPSSGPQVAYRDYRQPRISLLHPEYGRARQQQDSAMLPGGGGQMGVLHLDGSVQQHQQHQQQQQQSQHHQPLKKIRLQDHKEGVQPLRIDTREQPGVYNPQVEAISPTLPENVQEDQAFRTTKDELIQQIGKVDREIAKAESQILMLKKKQQELEEVALKPQVKDEVEEDLLAGQTGGKHIRSLPQKIYAENRKRAANAHSQLDNLGAKIEWPLYNQPTDSPVYHDNKRKNMHFKRRLLDYFKKKHAEKETRNAQLTETYSKLMQEWLRKVEKIESSTKKKAKEAKNREFFEKVFPVLRKQREDKERFSRVGSRVKSEADMEEIMDNLQEQAMEDKKMRSYAVIPPILSEKKDVVFRNENGYVDDMETMYKDRQFVNVWTPQEKEVFREKYLQHPKNFVVISSYLDRKSVADCVQYYYTSKKTENYKQLLRKSRQRARASKNTQKVNNSSANSSVVDILTTGVTTRLQREQQQKTVVKDASQSQESNSTQGAQCPPRTSTPSSSATPASATAATSSNSPPTSSPSIVPNDAPAPNQEASERTSNINNNSTPSAPKPPEENDASSTPSEKFTDFNSFEEYNNQIRLQQQSDAGAETAPNASSGQNEDAAVNNGRTVKREEGTTTPVGSGAEVGAVKMELGAATVKKEQESAPEGNSDQSAPNNANVVVLECKKKKERRKDKDSATIETSEDESSDVQADKSVQGNCIVCSAQLGTHLQSRALAPSQASQYGLREDQVPPGGRVCNTCRCKVVRSRYTHCPLPNCPNPRGRIKRLRSLPQRLQELPSDLKETLMAEFQLPNGVTKCCSACFNRIHRRLGPMEEWTEDEVTRLRNALSELGANWQAVAERLSKTPQQVRSFYSTNRKRLGLENCLGDNRKPTLTDEEESGSSTSSCEEQPVVVVVNTNRERHSSDTASAESPPSLSNNNNNNSINSGAANSGGSQQQTQQQQQQIVHIKKEDYDSSATETADEAQTTPDHYQGSATITPVAPDGQPRQNASPLSVKDLVLNVIEFSLMKNATGAATSQQMTQNAAMGGGVGIPTPGITPTISSILNNDSNEVTIVSEYNLSNAASQQINNNNTNSSNNVNNNNNNQRQQQQQHLMMQQQLARNEVNLAKLVTPLIGATITPVTGPIMSSQLPEQMINSGRDDLVVLQVQETQLREPETLDLSIKKPQSRMEYQPQQQMLHSNKPQQLGMLRQQESQYNIYHHQQHQHGGPDRNNKSPAAGSSFIRKAQQQQSPKLANPNPKAGSITLGTPMIAQRYDGLLRQMAPDPKMGSIVQGTPIHMAPHMQQADKRVYEIYKKMGPGQQQGQQQTTAGAPPSGGYPQQQYGAPGGVRQQQHMQQQQYNVEQQLSSRQIINDYITSQQMLSRRNESVAVGAASAPKYYHQGAPSSSASSSSSVPHRTPPPQQQNQAAQIVVQQQQRQGVIQRHTRPPYLPPGHEALSSLVDVAVQQPSLPVPVTPPHEGLGKTMADNIRDQPHRFQIIQHQQNVRQQQQHQQQQHQHQRLEEQQRRVYHHQQQQQQQPLNRPQSSQQRPPTDSSTLTAASLIDAIITHQINQTAEGGRGEVMPNAREPPRASDLLFQSFHRDPPGGDTIDNNRPPSVINVEIDSDGAVSKNLTVKELTDSVITHDFTARPTGAPYYHHMQQQQQQQENVVNEQWKRRLQQQQKENEKRAATPQDERGQIIRLAQPQKYHVEPVSPPESNHWNHEQTPSQQNYNRRFQTSANVQQQSQQSSTSSTSGGNGSTSSSHMSPLDYVKNRIVEVMRTEDDNKKELHHQDNHQHHNMVISEKERNAESPGEMVIDEEKNEGDYHHHHHHHQQQQQQNAASAYSTYPFVHKEMTNANVNDATNRNNEPKPLLSAQYEPLSDED